MTFQGAAAMLEGVVHPSRDKGAPIRSVASGRLSVSPAHCEGLNYLNKKRNAGGRADRPCYHRAE